MRSSALTTTLIAALASPAITGGPVLVGEEAEIVVQRPASSVNPVIPLLLLTVIAGAASGGSSGGDDAGTFDSSELP